MATKTCRYLGDGVYAKWDGYGIELRANDIEVGPMIYLEPEVLDNLNMFVEHIKEVLEEK